MTRQPMTATTSRSRIIDRRFKWICRDGGEADAQRPWHFLYFAPDPHQHGSFRPIRAPLGVNPGFGPSTDAPPPPTLVTGSSPSDSRIDPAVGGAAAPPRRMAEPPAAAAAGTLVAPAPTA